MVLQPEVVLIAPSKPSHISTASILLVMIDFLVLCVPRSSDNCPRRWNRFQIFPSNNNTIRTTTMSPTPPLGPYPQLLLCPQVGNTPTSAKIRTIRRIVPILIFLPRKEMSIDAGPDAA